MAKRGRPAKADGDKRNKRYLARFLPDTFVMLAQLADNRGISRAATLEQLIREAYDRINTTKR